MLVAQNNDIKLTNTFSAHVAQFIYFGTTITKPNLIQEDIKRGIEFG
jgi:hypothetical protein